MVGLRLGRPTVQPKGRAPIWAHVEALTPVRVSGAVGGVRSVRPPLRLYRAIKDPRVRVSPVGTPDSLLGHGVPSCRAGSSVKVARGCNGR